MAIVTRVRVLDTLNFERTQDQDVLFDQSKMDMVNAFRFLKRASELVELRGGAPLVFQVVNVDEQVPDDLVKDFPRHRESGS